MNRGGEKIKAREVAAAMAKVVVLRVIPNQISDDTIQVLQELLAEARTGRLIGLAVAGMYRERKYFVDTAGECRRNPTFTRGMIAALNDSLGRNIRG